MINPSNSMPYASLAAIVDRPEVQQEAQQEDPTSVPPGTEAPPHALDTRGSEAVLAMVARASSRWKPAANPIALHEAMEKVARLAQLFRKHADDRLALNRTRSALKRIIDDMDSETLKARRDVSSALQTTRTELAKVRTEIDAIRMKIEKLGKRLFEAKTALDAKSDAIDQKRAEAELLESRMNELTAQVGKNLERITDLKESRARLTRSLEKWDNRLSGKAKELTDRVVKGLFDSERLKAVFDLGELPENDAQRYAKIAEVIEKLTVVDKKTERMLRLRTNRSGNLNLATNMGTYFAFVALLYAKTDLFGGRVPDDAPLWMRRRDAVSVVLGAVIVAYFLVMAERCRRELNALERHFTGTERHMSPSAPSEQGKVINFAMVLAEVLDADKDKRFSKQVIRQLGGLVEAQVKKNLHNDTFHPQDRDAGRSALNVILRALGRLPMPESEGNSARHTAEKAFSELIKSESSRDGILDELHATVIDMAREVHKALGEQERKTLKEIVDARAQVESYTAEIDGLRSASADLNMQHENLGQERDALLSSIELLKFSKSEWEEISKTRRAEMIDLSSAYETLTAERNTKEVDEESLARQMAQLDDVTGANPRDNTLAELQGVEQALRAIPDEKQLGRTLRADPNVRTLISDQALDRVLDKHLGQNRAAMRVHAQAYGYGSRFFTAADLLESLRIAHENYQVYAESFRSEHPGVVPRPIDLYAPSLHGGVLGKGLDRYGKNMVSSGVVYSMEKNNENGEPRISHIYPFVVYRNEASDKGKGKA